MKTHEFTRLFNEYRLKSQIETASQFGEHLAEFGYAYEDSIFSKWKRGTRIPRNRDLLKAIITIFVKKRAISSTEEANELLRVLNHRDLTEEEIDKIFTFCAGVPFTVPDLPAIRLSREQYLKDVVWYLMNGHTTLINGISGSGKTTLAIGAAHFLKDSFRDGVLWFRGDIKSFDAILEEIGVVFGEKLSADSSTDTKTSIIKGLLQQKELLIIIDNAEKIEVFAKSFFPSKNDKYRLMFTAIGSFDSIKSISRVTITGFTQEESILLSEMILGKAFVNANHEKVAELSRKLDYSPLGTTVLLKQLVERPDLINKFLGQLNKGFFNLSSLQYDNKNLTKSLSIAYNQLRGDLQEVLAIVGIFKGADFDLNTVAHILDKTPGQTNELLLNLKQLSFVEVAKDSRFRLHPFVKIYLQSKVSEADNHKKLLNYYGLNFRPDRSDNPNVQKWISQEIDNIVGAYEKCYEYGFHDEVVTFWDRLCRHLWDAGKWSALEKYAQLLIKSASKTGNTTALYSCLVKDLAWLYIWRNDLKKALECLTMAKQLKVRDEALSAIYAQRNGVILQMKEDCKAALTELQKALGYFEREGNKTSLCDTYLYVGHCYKNTQRLDEAELYYIKSLDYGRRIRQHEGEAIALYYLGEVSFEQKKLRDAERYFKRSLSIDLKKDRKAGIAWCLYGLAKVRKAMKDKKNALNIFVQARKVFLKLGMRHQVSAVNTEIISLKEPFLID